MSAHEDLSRAQDIKGTSDRTFGYTLAAVLALIGLFPLLHDRTVRWWPMGISAAFLIVASANASALGPLNRLWIRLGALLNRIVSPIVSTLVFYIAVTPIALMMRLSGKDPLRLRLDPTADSYWLHRNPPGPDPGTMVNQF
jgi:hypothetical protein